MQGKVTEIETGPTEDHQDQKLDDNDQTAEASSDITAAKSETLAEEPGKTIEETPTTEAPFVEAAEEKKETTE